MISKNKIKLIRSLDNKKYRLQHRLFIAEGDKVVLDFIRSEEWKTDYLFAKTEWLKKLNPEEKDSIEEIHKITYEELKKISYLKTPHNVLALIRLPEEKPVPSLAADMLYPAFENIRDPGNLGTIIRIADWFGFRDIFCSEGSVDVFNPKVVQASMGSVIHTRVHYTNLQGLVEEAAGKNMPVYGTFLEGKPVFSCPLSDHGLVIFGNESKGISSGLEQKTGEKITIPSFPSGVPTLNSLNLSTATAIVCAEFRRRQMK